MAKTRSGEGFGSPRRLPRPIVLLIVYGIFLVVVGVTTTALTILVSAQFSTAALSQAVGGDTGTVRTFVNLNLRESDLRPALDDVRRADLASRLGLLVRTGNLAHVEVRLPDGTVVVSEDASLDGSHAAISADFARARDGTVAVALASGQAPSEAEISLAPTDLLREYLPLSAGSDVRAVVAVWRDAAPILRGIDDVRRQVVIVTLSGAVVAAIFLFFVFRAAQARISRQTIEIVEATRHDPLTGLLNHGSLSGLLATSLESARDRTEPVAVALVDIDGFRLLNETHGLDLGDSALQTVGRLLAERFDAESFLGRYGPDEFLVIVRGVDVAALEPAIEELQSALAAEALAVDAPDRIPITVSAGIAAFPADSESMTGLLATAAQSLAEAKASGGDVIRVAGKLPERSSEAKTFDVFQGLILAVDAKDRYTKRHCDDVARYGVFLGRLLDQDPETLQTIETAALLHDVGKIGIPDSILRKPARLTAEEFEIVKQHVDLGDRIVRDLPNIELVRAAIRHHHERWDGRGYLEALRGDDIPLVARILAVGDAFSAMTTTRPYRKALPVEEALKRLEDAGGSQLDERLVGAFVRAIRSAPDAPLPLPTDPKAVRVRASRDRVA